ncbi:MAG: Xaa-Pro peptidase family protein [Candidatus Hadarchaeum sp.]|uniref:Xaa-Pro peptidase family protein n=1 Tax=Candidatus Hadarchaeum sp. TaxID=2883567 RepID=UPI003170F03D
MVLDQRLKREIEKRVGKVRNEAIDRGFNGVVVFGKAPERTGNLVYLTNYCPLLPGHPTVYNFRGRGFGAFVLPVDKPSTLIVTLAFGFDAEQIVADNIIINTNLPAALADVFRERSLDRAIIGLVGEDVLSVALYKDILRLCPRVRFVTADDIVLNLRAVKSSMEIEFLEEGAQIGDMVAQNLREYLRPGLTEKEVVEFVRTELDKHGVQNPAATCQSGVKNSGEPMIPYGCTNRILNQGDMVHIEINGSYKGYRIDLCRSTVIGSASQRQVELLETIVEMMEKASSMLRPGIKAEEVEAIAAEVALRMGFKNNFTISCGGPASYIGHGIGLGIDEPPILAAGVKTILKRGMVICLEPGLYRTEVGGARIEDTFVIENSGPRNLSHFQRWW